jgi:hypothetical protein
MNFGVKKEALLPCSPDANELAFDLALARTVTSRSHDAAEKAPNQQPH